jgi:hypothetical protein
MVDKQGVWGSTYKLWGGAGLLCLWFVLSLGLVGGIAAQEATVTATATVTNTPPASPLSISGVQPNNVLNSFTSELAVTGEGFVSGAVLLLEGYGGLETRYVSENLLTAVLPTNVPPGLYSLRVINPSASSALLLNALTIRGSSETATPQASPTPPPTSFVRPQIIVQSYGASSAAITPNSNLAFEMTLANAGQIEARNVTITFKAGNFIPRETGGIQALGTLGTGQSHRFWQPLYATRELSGQTIATLEAVVSYTDANGTSYTDTFNLTFPVVPVFSGGGATATPSPTPTATPTPTLAPRLRPQLIITEYETDVAQLTPGTQFRLTLTVQNQGNAEAKRVTMIVGGGTAGGGSTGGTPEAGGGGLSGAGGEFSKFAPVGSSNVQFVGDIPEGSQQTLGQELIVNAATEAGAYPIRISFVYNDPSGAQMVDDQVITLLVYRRPQLTMNFYNPPPPLVAGEMGMLPLQVLNGGRNPVSLGMFRATAVNATLTNNEVFVGNLDANGFFPLDAQIIPDTPGSLDLLLSVEYTDDFGQRQTITQTMPLEVQEPFVFPEENGGEFPPNGGENGGAGGEPLPPAEESWGDWLWRVFLGLFGLSSAPSQP